MILHKILFLIIGYSFWNHLKPNSSVFLGEVSTPACLLITIQALGLRMKRCLCSQRRMLISPMLSSLFRPLPLNKPVWNVMVLLCTLTVMLLLTTTSIFTLFTFTLLTTIRCGCVVTCAQELQQGTDEPLVGCSNGHGADSLRLATWAKTSTGAKAVQNDIELK